MRVIRINRFDGQVREDSSGLAEPAGLVDRGDLRLRVDSAFDLEVVQDAHRHFLRGGLKGRVALTF
ncbi:zinc-binding dehydrogenase [Streptomyces sp. NPDC046237]|uniref:zinc-binding dehydrogenase n=1 Tax=Streptomyces sp. NPDC046237 TaxID=3154914 RepID=UPI0033FE33DB